MLRIFLLSFTFLFYWSSTYARPCFVLKERRFNDGSVGRKVNLRTQDLEDVGKEKRKLLCTAFLSRQMNLQTVKIVTPYVVLRIPHRWRPSLAPECQEYLKENNGMIYLHESLVKENQVCEDHNFYSPPKLSCRPEDRTSNLLKFQKRIERLDDKISGIGEEVECRSDNDPIYRELLKSSEYILDYLEKCEAVDYKGVECSVDAISPFLHFKKNHGELRGLTQDYKAYEKMKIRYVEEVVEVLNLTDEMCGFKEKLKNSVEKYSESDEVQRKILKAKDIVVRAKDDMIYGSRLKSGVIKQHCKDNKRKPSGFSCNACYAYTKAILCEETEEEKNRSYKSGKKGKLKFKFRSGDVKACTERFNGIGSQLAEEDNANVTRRKDKKPWEYYIVNANASGEILERSLGYTNLKDLGDMGLFELNSLRDTPKGAAVVYEGIKHLRRDKKSGQKKLVDQNVRYGHVEIYDGERWYSDHAAKKPRTHSIDSFEGRNRRVSGIYVKLPSEIAQEVNDQKKIYRRWFELMTKVSE